MASRGVEPTLAPGGSVALVGTARNGGAGSVNGLRDTPAAAAPLSAGRAAFFLLERFRRGDADGNLFRCVSAPTWRGPG